MPTITRNQIAKKRSENRGSGTHGVLAKTWRQIQKLDIRAWADRLCFQPTYLWRVGCGMISVEFFLCLFIINRVAYTEIDWTTYMQQVSLFMNGTWDYTEIGGDTGPLPYPAGHLYIYSLLFHLTEKGSNIRHAQFIFMGLYLLNLGVVFRIYHRLQKLPPFVLLFVCCASYRVHSLFLLRLFNDPVAMLIFYCSLLLMIEGQWTAGCLVYSLAVSVKMNVLLAAPGLLLVLLVRFGVRRAFLHIASCGLVQLLLAVPFLVGNAWGYMGRSFNLGRVFLYEWTVNWRCISEELFLDPRFHLLLLFLHLLTLGLLAHFTWFKKSGGLWSAMRSKKTVVLSPEEIVFPMLSANFVGVMFSRSLHYQFYSWYFHSLPLLLWATPFPAVFNLCIWGFIELCWLTFQSTVWSSLSLHLMHFTIFLGIFYKQSQTFDAKKRN